MKKIFLLFAIGMVFAGCSDSGSSNGGGIAAQSYSVKGTLDYEGVPFDSAKVCVDDNNNGLADDGEACGDVNKDDGSYEFTAWTDPATKNLVAYVYERGNGGTASSVYMNASTLAKSGNAPDSIMYASWKRASDNITLKTTFIKAIIDQDPAKAVTEAEKEVETVIKQINDTAAILKSFRDILSKQDNLDDIRSVTAAIVNKYVETKSLVTDITADDIKNAKNTINEADKSAGSLARIKAILDRAEVMPEIDLIKYDPVIEYIGEVGCSRSKIEFSGDKMRNDFNIAMQNLFYPLNDTLHNIEMHYDYDTKKPFAELDDYEYCSSYSNTMGIIAGYFYSYPSGMLEDSDDILEKIYKGLGVKCEVDEDGSVKDISCSYDYMVGVIEKLPTPKKYLWKLDTSKVETR